MFNHAISELFGVLSLVGLSSQAIIYAGVDESGGEFGVYSADAVLGTGLPGEFGVTYAFINESTVDIYLENSGINLIRVAFLLERMCPVDFTTGKGLGPIFNETYFSEYADAINYITGKGAYALIDPHNYMRYNDPSQQPLTGSVIGNTSDPRAASLLDYTSFFGEMALRFKDNEKVIFSLMNEPHDMPTSLLFELEQAAILAIRAVGAEQLISVPGNGYTGGHSFTQTVDGDEPSSDYFDKIIDPLDNYVIEIHEYLDIDFSGSHNVCAQPAPENLANVTAWAKEHNLKLLLTEFGYAPNEVCYEMATDLLEYLANNDEWIGWSQWAAGPLWGSADSCCGPDTGNLEPGTLTTSGTAGGYETMWLALTESFVPTTGLKRSGVSSTHL